MKIAVRATIEDLIRRLLKNKLLSVAFPNVDFAIHVSVRPSVHAYARACGVRVFRSLCR